MKEGKFLLQKFIFMASTLVSLNIFLKLLCFASSHSLGSNKKLTGPNCLCLRKNWMMLTEAVSLLRIVWNFLILYKFKNFNFSFFQFFVFNFPVFLFFSSTCNLTSSLRVPHNSLYFQIYHVCWYYNVTFLCFSAKMRFYKIYVSVVFLFLFLSF